MKLAVFCALLGLAYTAVPPQKTGTCKVGGWSEWSDCKRPHLCPHERPLDVELSYSLPVPEPVYDEGRAHMSYIRRTKLEQSAKSSACKIAGTCPELIPPPSTKEAEECRLGYAGVYPCRNVDFLSFTNFDDLTIDAAWNPYEGGTDIWGWEDPETGDEYALQGLRSGTSFVRVTDPINPEVLAYLPTNTDNSDWRDIKVYKDHAFIVSEASRHGMQVFDLTLLRDMKAPRGTPPRKVEANAIYERFGNAHNIAINEETGYAYVIGQTSSNAGSAICVSPGGLHIINIQDPKNPVFEACFNNDGYTHDTQCVIYRGPDLQYYEREICFSSNENTLTITDVTDKSNLVMVSRTGYSGSAYTHQAWLTPDHTRLLLDDELDEMFGYVSTTRTLMWDVTNLRTPIHKSSYFSSQKSVDHNQYTHGDFVYQSNYMAGLRILHIEEHTLTESAYFDVRPDLTDNRFEGTWSNYPYFKSGNLILSSMDYGLFVLRPNMDAMMAAATSETPYGEQTRHRDVTDSGEQCPRLAETRPCNPGPC